MSEYEDLAKLQKKLYDNLIDKEGAYNSISPIFKEASKEDLLAILDVAKDNNMLEKVLTTPNEKIKYPDDGERTLTPLGFAVSFGNLKENIKAILDVAKDNNMLEKVLTTPNEKIKYPDGEERTLTPLGFAVSLCDSEENIKAILDVAKDNNMLEKILTTPNEKIKCPDGEERTLTPLGFAIDFINSEENIKAILDVAKDNNMLEKVLTTPNEKIKYPDGEERTLTPLGFAVYFNNSEENIKAILDVAKDNNMLEKVLTTTNIIKHPYGKERTLTSLDFAISFGNLKEKTKAILDVTEKDKAVLNEVFVGIKKRNHEKLKGILETLKDEEQDKEQKTKIDGWLEILAKSKSSCESNKKPLAPKSSISKTEENIVNNKGTKDKDNDAVEIESNTSKIENSDKYPQKDTVKTINRSIMIGSVCGVIAALAVGGGLFAAGVELPILALIGIAVAAALVIGVIAGGITYSVSKPSDKLDKPDLEIAGQQVGEAI